MNDRRFAGLTMKSIYSFPQRMDLWEEYQRVWETVYDDKVLELGIAGKAKANQLALEAASAFYLQRRAEMDEGLEMSWPAKYGSDKYTGASAEENIMCERQLESAARGREEVQRRVSIITF